MHFSVKNTALAVIMILLGSLIFSVSADTAKRNVAILIFDGVQIIDYTGPYEVLGQQGRTMTVYTVSENTGQIRTNMGMQVVPHYSFDDAPRPDVMVIPGGSVSQHLSNDAIINWVRNSAGSAEIVLSVCNGAFFLAEAGLLDGLEVTTTASLIDRLRMNYPKLKVVYDKRFVDSGKIITAAGLSAGIDAALHVVSRLHGLGRAQTSALNIEYNWQPDKPFARADFADFRTIRSANIWSGFEQKIEKTSGDTENWECAWLISSEESPAAIFARLENNIASGTDWKARNISTANKSGQWLITDRYGYAWRNDLKVSDSGKKEGQFRVTMIVSREAGPARTPIMDIIRTNAVEGGKILQKAEKLLKTEPDKYFINENAMADLVLELYNAGYIELATATSKFNAKIYSGSPNAGSNLFRAQILTGEIEKAKSLFEKIMRENRDDLLIHEGRINMFGYKLMGMNKLVEAIMVLRLNVAAFPKAFNTYDSLGEAYMRDGQNDLAIQNYRKSLALNPENGNAVRMLKKLGEQAGIN